MKKLTILLTLVLALSCIKEPDFNQTAQEETSAYANFDFSSVSDTQIELQFNDASGSPLKGIKIQLLDPDTDLPVFVGFTNSTGQISETVTLAKHLSAVV